MEQSQTSKRSYIYSLIHYHSTYDLEEVECLLGNVIFYKYINPSDLLLRP